MVIQRVMMGTFDELGGAAPIEIEGLEVRRRGRMILSSLSVEIAGGVVTGLLGPSGSGKTTLMRAIVGVQIVSRGTVTVLGEPAGSPEVRRRVGYMTQAPSVYSDLTVRENLSYYGRVLGVRPSGVEEVVRTVGLGNHIDQVVSTLSGGERSRVSLAVAMLGKPRLLILDEPTVGVDPTLRRDLWETFHTLAESGITILVSTHVMDEADRCDFLILMRDGGIVDTGSPEELRRRTGTQNLEDAFLTLATA
jgi:ABC-2 type transport system ATP-binding protein